MAVRFIENKLPDMAVVSSLLAECATQNQWTNFGPVYHRLADEYACHMQLPADTALVPCANAGIGLELLARTLAAQAGVGALRWVGPSLSFKNLGRGYFASMTVLDCDAAGLLDLEAVKRLPPDTYDGIVVINPFGMCTDFSRFVAFAQATGKKLLIDNAAGLAREIPAWPWQVFSLHQTKPYGVGEGGLAVVPRDGEDLLRSLMNYAQIPENPAHWLNNGKISDIACAFQLARLRGIDGWESGYRDQRDRIAALAADVGVCPLYDPGPAPLTTSLPLLLPAPLDEAKLTHFDLVPVSRQYAPLVSRPRADALFARLINFPVHPDMAHLTDIEISTYLEQIIDCCFPVPGFSL